MESSSCTNRSKFNHYVPRFYLARFVGPNGMLQVFDKITDRVFESAPDNIAGENKFYDVDDLKTIGQDPQLLEKQLADIEAEACKITENWLFLFKTYGKITIPQINREIISLFLALQLHRTAEARITLVHFVKMMQAMGKIRKEYDAEKDARGLHTHFVWDTELTDKLTKKIADCIWIFAKNDSGYPFYTSDNPALVKSFNNKQWLLNSDVFKPGMYTVYPLSPKWIWYCYDRKPWNKLAVMDGMVSPVRFDKDMVNHENSGQVGRSNRFIFSDTSDFVFAREYLKDYPVHKDQNRKRLSA